MNRAARGNYPRREFSTTQEAINHSQCAIMKSTWFRVRAIPLISAGKRSSIIQSKTFENLLKIFIGNIYFWQQEKLSNEMSVRGTIPLGIVRWGTARRVNALGQLSVGEKPAGKMPVGELSGYHLLQCSLSLKEQVNIQVKIQISLQ